MPFQAAIAFRNGQVTVDEFDVKYIDDPLIKRLIANTTVVEDPEFEKRYPEHYSSAVKITMKDGTIYESVIDDPRVTGEIRLHMRMLRISSGVLQTAFMQIRTGQRRLLHLSRIWRTRQTCHS